MKVYVTRWGLSTGILVYEVPDTHISALRSGSSKVEPIPGRSLSLRAVDENKWWFIDEASALITVEKARKKKAAEHERLRNKMLNLKVRLRVLK